MPSEQFRAAASLWRRKMGGELPWGPAARAFKPIETHPEFLDRLSRYLDAHQGEKSVYANPWKFAQTFGQWTPQRVPRPTGGVPNLEETQRYFREQDSK